ncbi:SNF2-related protein [Nitratidesulfovibrio liaohensis]|uniref:SNF2-related protein n=1 Tax=Nitratidesulfovibrio liaohensis TaxID=2604158 RepID=UPI00141E1C28|nr:SNF2-related protein [Nitratidesulfovibrio liaohensis]NHZ47043.1 hypothetical protein [Nitratidesulfovibrio liaohensis]
MTKFSPGDKVRYIHDASMHGIVLNSPPRATKAGLVWRIQWNSGQIDSKYEDELQLNSLNINDIPSLIMLNEYGRSDEIQRNLTHVQLSGRLSHILYSLGITNTIFFPHQFKPLLRLLDSPVNSLLIADEVGLGKTIEAGLIWTELRARYNVDYLLIVCPAMLKEKWKHELYNRFGIDSKIIDADDLHSWAKLSRKPRGQQAFIAGYQSLRPSKNWDPIDTEQDSRKANRLASHLYSIVDGEPLFDLVIFDEAHYMRNRDSATWKICELLRNITQYRIMLSATPINIKNRDLYNLLHLLDPDGFAHELSFEKLLEANRPLVKARDAVLSSKPHAETIKNYILEATSNDLLLDSKTLKHLLEQNITQEALNDREYRHEISSQLEKSNLLSYIINRTRKKEVQEKRTIRDVKPISVEMTSLEQKAYHAVTNAIRDYAIENQINEGFLLATAQRQITSCPAAAVNAWLRSEVTDPDVTLDFTSDTSENSFRNILPSIVRDIDPGELEQNDSKLSQLIELLRHSSERKILIFTTFRATARYLERKLRSLGHPAAVLMGGMKDKQDILDTFSSDAETRLLITTEVSAEGLDLQFCKVLINYDLPWNPMRIEQRIGRIDRIGQESPKIWIKNIVFRDSIDEKILSRLIERIDTFQDALGDSEAIIGEEMRNLERNLLCKKITLEEEATIIEQTAQALTNNLREQKSLNDNAPILMAHGQRILEEATKDDAYRITNDDLFMYVHDFLKRHTTGYVFQEIKGDFKQGRSVRIKLPTDIAEQFADFCRKEQTTEGRMLAAGIEHPYIFLNKIGTQQHIQKEIIHQFHAFIRFISAAYQTKGETFYPLIAVKLKRANAIEAYQSGTYFFLIASWTFTGIRQEEHLVPYVIHCESNTRLDMDVARIFIDKLRTEGTDLIDTTHIPAPQRALELYDDAEIFLRSKYERTLELKRIENEERARIQIKILDQHTESRVSRFESTAQTHISFGRNSLAKAVTAQKNLFIERVAIKKAEILKRSTISPMHRIICAGITIVT